MFSFEPVLYSPISHWSLALQGFWFARVPAVSATCRATGLVYCQFCGSHVLSTRPDMQNPEARAGALAARRSFPRPADAPCTMNGRMGRRPILPPRAAKHTVERAAGARHGRRSGGGRADRRGRLGCVAWWRSAAALGGRDVPLTLTAPVTAPVPRTVLSGMARLSSRRRAAR